MWIASTARRLVMIAVAVALVVPASAGAVVRKVSFTGTVSPNDYANLTVRVAPKSRCTITVIMTEQGETAERDNGSRDDAVGIGNWSATHLRASS